MKKTPQPSEGKKEEGFLLVQVKWNKYSGSHAAIQSQKLALPRHLHAEIKCSLHREKRVQEKQDEMGAPPLRQGVVKIVL